MAIETRIVNNSFTEIYVGGGNYLTQSAPTNFHQFYKRKILTDGESADDFREVTTSQKSQIEASDAKWEAPKPWEIQQWEEWSYVKGKRYGCYNPTTGFAELNGKKDIALDEMRTILASAFMTRYFLFTSVTFMRTFQYNGKMLNKCRTLMPICHSSAGGQTGPAPSFEYWDKIETVQFCNNNYTNYERMFYSCRNLRRVLGISLNIGGSGSLKDAFARCTALEALEAKDLYKDLSLADSPKLSVESVRYMIENRRSDGVFGQMAFTLTLHPEAYARVTDELFALAAEKNITIASTE